MKQLLFITCFFCMMSGFAQRQMEYLNRGVYAINQGNGKVFVSWRLLATDDDAIAFNLYRTAGNKTIKINKEPISTITGFTDEAADSAVANTYTIKTLLKGKEQQASGSSFTLKAQSLPYLSIPLHTPPGYAPNDASVGDVDGDGEYEIFIHMAGRGRDNSQAGNTDVPIIQAYKLNGTFLWQINLGKNIREGAHYTQMMVYDLDGDGKAEICMKTADGTIDGMGKVIGDSTKDWRNGRGYILSGPEYFTVFDGATGAALATDNYNPPRYSNENPTEQELKAIWGDGYGNRMDRFIACIAYLDGVHPSVVMCRG